MNTKELSHLKKCFLTSIKHNTETKEKYTPVRIEDYQQLFSLVNSIIKTTNASVLYMCDHSEQKDVELMDISNALTFVQSITNGLYIESEFLDKINSHI